MASRSIEDLYPPIQPLVRTLLEEANKVTAPWTTFITDGYRSNIEQDALYAQGRTTGGSIVTNARGGESNHNYGLAIDLAFQNAGKLSYSLDLYKKIVPIAKRLGFAWGGDWVSFPDKPHFEYTQGLTIKQLKAGQRPVVGSIIEEIRTMPLPLYVDKRNGRVYFAFDGIAIYIGSPVDLGKYWAGITPNEIADIHSVGTPLEDIIASRDTFRSELDATKVQIESLAKEIEILKNEVFMAKNQPPEIVTKIEVKEVPTPLEKIETGRLVGLILKRLFSRG